MRVEVPGLRVYGLGFEVSGLGLRIQLRGIGFRVESLRRTFTVWRLEFDV